MMTVRELFGLRLVWVIAKREVRSFVLSPLAYVVVLAWTYITGLTYYGLAHFFAQNPASVGSDNPLSLFFGGTVLFWIPLLIFAPLMSMRLFAGERSEGTLEGLLTTPIQEWQIVLGKFLSAMVFWMLLWVPTLLFVWVTSRFGHIDLGVVGTSYLGVLLLGMYFMSVGLLMSALAPTPMSAAVLSFMVLALLYVGGLFRQIVYGLTEEVLTYVSVSAQMEDFSRGIVDSRWVVFDLSLMVASLLLTNVVLTWRRVSE